MRLPTEIADLVAHYSLPEIIKCESLSGAGGFSGARFWRLTDKAGDVRKVRQWPAGTAVERVRSIHRVVRYAHERGCEFLAPPMSAASGDTLVECASGYFEVARWIDGVADFHQRPSEPRLVHAMHALARFHEATAPLTAGSRGIPPCITSRLDRISQLRAGLAFDIRDRITDHAVVSRQEAERILGMFEQRQAELATELQCAQQPAPLLPCLRDIWHDHVLFREDQVVGFIDYDAIHPDAVATDLSRLLGSLLGGKLGGAGSPPWRLTGHAGRSANGSSS